MQEEKRVRIRSVPSLTLVDVKAITREKMTIAGVRMCEKVVHLKAHGGYELHRLCHLGRSEDEERQEEAADTMTAATGEFNSFACNCLNLLSSKLQSRIFHQSRC